jgi:PAT family acetyl-CoA transporter-like MFS transporter 1
MALASLFRSKKKHQRSLVAPSAQSTDVQSSVQSSSSDAYNIVLLIVLYMIQGVPLGLSMGSMPFLLQNIPDMSYTKIGIFTIAGYPYSFKLLWSPIVDTVYSPFVGQRKSWILPLQLLSGGLMIAFGPGIERVLYASKDVQTTTMYFFVLVLLAATQDIAVDGWALTLLSKGNVGYAATCQTIGMNIGYFMSFTIFLALNDASFCAKWLGREGELLTLGGYLWWWGWAYVAVTVLVGLFKREGTRARADVVSITPDEGGVDGTIGGEVQTRHSARQRVGLSRRKLSNAENGVGLESVGEPSQAAGGEGRAAGSASYCPGTKDHHGEVKYGEVKEGESTYGSIALAYSQLFDTIRLPPVKLLCVLLIVSRLAMLPAESAAPLKLLEKGVSKEALAGLVLIEFPIELVSAVVAGRWAASSHPLRPWLAGFKIRLTMAFLTTLCVYYFPVGVADIPGAPGAFLCLIVLGVLTSFSSTLMFTALGDFYNRISDPSMGGAYLTMLNTVANIGVVVPKIAVFYLIDLATIERNGTKTRDGFYVVSFIANALGIVLLMFLGRIVRKLEHVPVSAWRCGGRTSA